MTVALAQQKAGVLQFLQAAAHSVDAFAAVPGQIGDGALPALPMGTEAAEDLLRLEGDPAVPKQRVGDLREPIPCHHPATFPGCEAAHPLIHKSEVLLPFPEQGPIPLRLPASTSLDVHCHL
ncbi:hypothetical protein [Streptomyces sp. NPDC047043]|uniref:hypothetical protein n=1 Tax=Streptomyces sp. NPDC047043 TaxID=3154497 RepID=UPI0033D34807